MRLPTGGTKTVPPVLVAAGGGFRTARAAAQSVTTGPVTAAGSALGRESLSKRQGISRHIARGARLRSGAEGAHRMVGLAHGHKLSILAAGVLGVLAGGTAGAAEPTQQELVEELRALREKVEQ